MEKVTYVWKIKLSRPWTFDYSDSCKLRVISHIPLYYNDRIQNGEGKKQNEFA